MRLPPTKVPFLLDEILYRHFPALDGDASVMSRDFWRVQPHRHAGLSADEVLPIRETELEVAADKPTDRRVNGIGEARSVGKLGDSRDRKPIAVRVDGLKESVAPRVIADRVADLTHRAGQTRIRHEDARPDPLEQLLLRERARAILDQDLQELEGLRR